MTKADHHLVEQIQSTCSEFCSALTVEEVARFTRYTRVKEVAAKEVIADIGELGERFYLVIDGAVDLFQVEGDQQFNVGSQTPGNLVGEMSFFDRRPRTVRLCASDNGARLVEINRQMYNRIRIEEPYIATNLLEFVIRSLDSLVRSLSDDNARLNSRLRHK
jgi:CRP-like cAMP-binding protein